LLHDLLTGLAEGTVVQVGAGSNGLRLQVLLQNCVVVGDAVHAKRVEVLRAETRQLVQRRRDLIQALDLGLRVNNLLFVDQECLRHKLVRNVLEVQHVRQNVDCLNRLQIQTQSQLREVALNFAEEFTDHRVNAFVCDLDLWLRLILVSLVLIDLDRVDFSHLNRA